MNIIIAGSRNFNNYTLLSSKCDKILSNVQDVTIISGRARGADTLGERYAKERNYNIILKPANWNKYGRSAGYRRNVDMAEIADGLIAFWDGRSRGTKDMIDIATERGLHVRVIKY